VRFPGTRVTLVWGPPEPATIEHRAGTGPGLRSRLYALAPEVAVAEEVGEASAANRRTLRVMQVFGTCWAGWDFYWWRLTGSPPPDESGGA
jgi:hypothetical protein